MSMNNETLRIIHARHCTRSFLDEEVPKEAIVAVLRAAASAPSSQNTQPWKVAALTGASKNRLSTMLCEHFDANGSATPDYLNRPKDLAEDLAERAASYGRDVFAFKGIARDDETARNAHRRQNFELFGAPMELIFHLPSNAAPGTFLDLGFFMQNVILGLESLGLASCPQYSVASFSKVVRECLGLGSERIIISGMAVGYRDEASLINQFFPARASLEDYVQFFE